VSLAAYTASYVGAAGASTVANDVEQGKGGYGATETPVVVATAVPVDA
jgi:hypothetical protein